MTLISIKTNELFIKGHGNIIYDLEEWKAKWKKVF